MQAAAAVSALIKPAPTASAGGGVASADVLASLTGPTGVDGGTQAGPIGAGDAFAQALAALMGAPAMQPPPAPTTVPSPGDVATAPTPRAGGGPLPPARATIAPEAAPATAAPPSLSPSGAPPAAAKAPAAIAIPAELLAQSGARGAGLDASFRLPAAAAATNSSAQPTSTSPQLTTQPPQAATLPASAPIIVSPALIPSAMPPAPALSVSSPSPAILSVTPVNLVAMAGPTASATDNEQASAPASAQATSAVLAAPLPTVPPRQAAQAGAKPAADGKSPSAPDQSSAPHTPLLALADRPIAPVAVAPTNPAGSGHGDRSDESAANNSRTAASAASQTPDANLVTQPAPAAQVQAASAATKPVGASIVGQIADQVIKSVNGKSTRFDVALNPAGLGQVNVKVEINAAGQVSAALSFDNPHAAAEARAHAGELKQALEQAGFNLGQGGLSFDVGGQGASLARQDQGQGQPFQARPSSAFVNLADTVDALSSPAAPMPRAASGVNILI